jgi:hypothetical protein
MLAASSVEVVRHACRGLEVGPISSLGTLWGARNMRGTSARMSLSRRPGSAFRPVFSSGEAGNLSATVAKFATIGGHPVEADRYAAVNLLIWLRRGKID